MQSDEPTDNGVDDEQGPRVGIRLAPGEEKCRALGAQAQEVLEAVESLASGIRLELDLRNPHHRIFHELAQACSAIEEIAWILHSQGILNDIKDEADEDDEAEEEDETATIGTDFDV
jgi:hypothetical protein